MCGKQTFGVFNPAKELIERLRLEEENKLEKERDSDEEFQFEVTQPSGSSTQQQSTEEPVTEIEHIQYEDDGVQENNDSDSEDSDEYDEYEPTPADKIKEKIISYGYDPEVVSAWLENKGATWDELSRAQAEAKAEIAKVHIAEANTYF